MSSYGPPPGPGQHPEYDPNNPAGQYPPPAPYGPPSYGTPPQGAQGDIPPPPPYPTSGGPNFATPPVSGQPNYGAPVSGQPGYGAPVSGQPGYGAPVSGQPGYGAPVSGQPGYGTPGYGETPQAPYAAPYGDPNMAQQPPVQGYGAPLPPPGPQLQGGWAPPPQQKSGAGKVVGIIVGAVAVFALLICGGVFFAARQASDTIEDALTNVPTTVPTFPTEDPFPTPTETGGDDEAENVQVGDCIVNDGTDDNASIRKVPCAKDTMEVLIRIPFTDDGEEACKDIEGADSWYMYTSTAVGGVGDYVLCLKTLTETPRTS
ncbi:LppU/SCO3897 family protein [Catenuloplanes atrovinosus]|uniref:Uncharacterized protein n=1 Tax=Catenuloplanes atrovinosus TaxID=137266 RepID=A0AAE4CEF1_9ACTN|nr:hypothetical protein [Catenuloplanes atrovinosus]MDR7280004.1 hypothetical protein [Catenuloplanes atrovinosus]